MRFAGLGLAAASVVAALALLPAAASAEPGSVAMPAHTSDVQPVYYCSKKAWRRGLCGGQDSGSYVRAPFTEVDTLGELGSQRHSCASIAAVTALGFAHPSSICGAPTKSRRRAATRLRRLPR